MTRLAIAGALAAALAGCDSFQDPNVVLDLRVLAMAATPPDQVIDVELDPPPTPESLLAQLVPSQVCALVADPDASRRLRWSMQACPPNREQRCDEEPRIALGAGIIEDPDTAVPAPALCATVPADLNLLALLAKVLDDDELSGLGGLDYNVELRFGGEDDDPALDQYAGKTLRVLPRIPAAATANQNPQLENITATIDGSAPVALPLGRCVDNPTPYELPAGARVRLLPIEAPGARETYVVPTLDGKSQTFTESLTYQWRVSAGGVSPGSTGGPRDSFGNPAPLFTDLRAPDPEDVPAPTDVSLWIIQRDERLGARWYESCVRVRP